MKKSQKFEKESHILVLGELDITLKINFKDEDLEIKSKDEKETNKKSYYKLKNLSEISSLSFIKDNKDLIHRIQFNSKNELIKLLMIGNLNSENIGIIDYICFGAPIFTGDESFFNDILDMVTMKYGIIFNKNPLNVNAGYSIKIVMSHGDQKNEILIESNRKNEHEEDNDILEEGDTIRDDFKFDDDYEDEYPISDAMKKHVIPKFKRKNLLCNMNPIFSRYDMLYFNYEDLNKISKNFKIEYTLELIDFLKKKKCIIFVNYYISIRNTNNEDNKQKNEILNGIRASKEELLELLNKFYYVTDIYFFDKKQAVKFFAEHYKLFTVDLSQKIISMKNVYDYFIKGIVTGTASKVSNEKTGIFLDEFNEFCLIQVSKKSVYKQEYEPHLFPKINAHNLEEVSEYKDIIAKNKNDFYSLFLSKMVITISHAPKGSSINSMLAYPAYLTGIDLVKKKMEYIKNDIKILETDDKFYKIKKHPKIILNELEKLSNEEKEEKFLLDCTNKIKSNKKEYVSLFDFHLQNYFSNQLIRKDLENKGFIDSQGYILYDPLNKDVMSSNIEKKRLTEEQMKKKIISDINDIKIHTLMNYKKINDIDILKKNNFNMSIGKKIPFIKEDIQSQKITKNKINNKKGSGFCDGFRTGINYKKK